jgi:glycosyltransferase involved in cell wall biosynthesis
MRMKRILIFVPNYFPGYMSGGIARTILNTTEWLGEEFKFLIVTRDRDLGSDTPYGDVRLGTWNRLGKADVRYLSPSELSLRSLADFINSLDYDVLHLNSFFDSVFTIKLLLLMRLGKIRPRSVLLSPRGEFVAGPLGIKYPKKKLYIESSKFLGFYNAAIWHASSPHEAEGIVEAMKLRPDSIRVAIDLPVKDSDFAQPARPRTDRLRVVFLSRITREKNLDGALRILQNVRSDISFDIVGPQEDEKYWSECAALMQGLPANVQSTYIGAVSPEQVFNTLAGYDVFLFPSLGENYGHVVAESISVGTRVLISQFTPWRNLEHDGVGWDIDLQDTNRFVEVIEALARQSPSDRMAARDRVRKSAMIRLFNPEALQQNRLLYSNI